MLVAGLAWMVALVAAMVSFADDGAASSRGWLLTVGCLVSLAWVLAELMEYESEHPCAQYETRMQYNAALKTMAPMRVCVLRGEWVSEGGDQ